MMKSKISIYALFLILFIIIYSFWISSTFNSIQLSYDESRHASGGMIWHDYIKTIIYDNYINFDDFVNLYQKMGYNAGWFVNQDPAFDSILRALFYFIFGPTFFAIRFMALVCAIISAILLYVIGYQITKQRVVALSSSVILLMSTLFYMYSAIQALAPIPIIMMTLFWYYFTFVKTPKKKYKLKLFKEFYVEFNWNIILGGLFMTLATLIQYAAALFIDIFYLLYIIYLIVIKYSENKKESKKLSILIIQESGALQIVFIAFIQNLVFILISYKWLKYNLFEMHWLERIKYYTSYVSECTHDLNYISVKYPWLGWGTTFSNFTYLIHGYLQRTAFFVIFFGYTLYLLLKNKIEDIETKKHLIIITLFFLSIYLYFSFRISNHQIRYAAHVFPLVILASAYGLYHLVQSKFKQKQMLIFLGIIVLFIIALFSLDSWIYQKTFVEFGEKNEELLDFLKSKPEQKILLHAPGTGSSKPPNTYNSWYYSPDYVLFTFMRTKTDYNPLNFKQQGHLYEYPRSNLEEVSSASKNLVNQLKSIPKEIPIYVVVYRYHEPDFYSVFGSNFLTGGYSAVNLTYWTIYYKE